MKAIYFDAIMTIERLHRLFLEVVRVELDRLKIDVHGRIHKARNWMEVDETLVWLAENMPDLDQAYRDAEEAEDGDG